MNKKSACICIRLILPPNKIGLGENELSLKRKLILLALCIIAAVSVPYLYAAIFTLVTSNNRWENSLSNPTTGNLAVDPTSLPIQDIYWIGYSSSRHYSYDLYDIAENWQGTTLTTVCLTVNQSYFLDGPIAYQDFATEACIRILSGLGIKAVDTPPFDAAITVNITGRPLGEYYVFRDGHWRIAERDVRGDFVTVPGDAKLLPTAACVDLGFFMSQEDRETLTLSHGSETSNPLELDGLPRLVDLPMTKAVAPALIETFAAVWGDQVLINALQDPDELIRCASAQVCNKIYDGEQPVNGEIFLTLARASLDDESSRVRSYAGTAMEDMVFGGWAFGVDLLPEFSSELVQVVLHRYGADESWITLDSKGNIVSMEPQAIDTLIDRCHTDIYVDTDTGRIPGSLASALSIEALGYVGSPAIPSISEALRDAKFRWDVGLTYALGRIGPEAIPALLDVVECEDYRFEYDIAEDMRFGAVLSLGYTGQEGIDILIEFLENRSIAWDAEKVLTRIGSEAVPALIEALSSENEDVRWHAACSLGDIKPAATQAVPALIEALNDEDVTVRDAAAVALMYITGEYFEDQAQWLEYWNQQ